jgi:hypothetical protein
MLWYNCINCSRETYGTEHIRIKRRKKLQSSVKNIHYSIDLEEIITEIEKPGHTVTNISIIKQHRTKFPVSMIFVELKPVPNNKDIFNEKI